MSEKERSLVEAGSSAFPRRIILVHKENKILEWLSPVDVESDQHGWENLRTEGTGDWIFGDERFETWFTTRGSLLWLHGHSMHHLKNVIII